MTPTKKNSAKARTTNTKARAVKAVRSTTRQAARPTAKRVSTSAAKTATTGTVQEVFTTQPQHEAAVSVEKGKVALYVNGNSRGQVDTNNKTLAEFVREKASNAGIRTFSVYVDGLKADTSMGGSKLDKFAKVEIVAKDARG